MQGSLVQRPHCMLWCSRKRAGAHSPPAMPATPPPRLLLPMPPPALLAWLAAAAVLLRFAPLVHTHYRHTRSPAGCSPCTEQSPICPHYSQKWTWGYSCMRHPPPEAPPGLHAGKQDSRHQSKLERKAGPPFSSRHTNRTGPPTRRASQQCHAPATRHRCTPATTAPELSTNHCWPLPASHTASPPPVTNVSVPR